jgi:hypothetical protein
MVITVLFTVILSIFSTTGHAQDVQCLDFGWLASFKNKKCEADRGYQTNEQCSKSEHACNPAIFGPLVCVKKASKNSNLSCLSKKQGSNVSKVAQHILSNEAELEQFEGLYLELQIMCDPDFGDSRNNTYCEKTRDWVEKVVSSIHQIQNHTPQAPPLEDLIEFSENLNNFVNENLSSKSLGEQVKSEDPEEVQPKIFDSPRDSSLPIPDQEASLITVTPSLAPRSSQEIIMRFPSKSTKLNLYRLNPNRLIPDFETKKYYLDLKRTDSLPATKELKVKGYALANELVKRLRSNFDPKYNKDLVHLLNSLEPEDWKKALIGDEKKDKNIFRHSGVLELRRKYHDIDEHLEIMMNEKYTDKDFEKEYFIPTGFIEVEDNQYLSINEIIDGNIEIDPNTMKINVIKNVTLYVFNEISQKGNVDDRLQEMLNENLCKQECIIPKGILFGDIIEKISRIETYQSNEVNGATYCLLLEYFKVCPSISDYRRLDKIKKKLDIRPNCSKYQ